MAKYHKNKETINSLRFQIKLYLINILELNGKHLIYIAELAKCRGQFLKI
jgi:hypothetical protein